MLEQLVQQDIGVHIPPQLDADPKAFTVRFIPDAGDPIHLFNQLGDLLDQPGLIDQVWDLCHDDPVLSVGQGLDVGDGPDLDLAPPRPISLLDACPAHDRSTGREVRAFDDLHDLL